MTPEERKLLDHQLNRIERMLRKCIEFDRQQRKEKRRRPPDKDPGENDSGKKG